jgi:hypothetical protein
MILILVLIAVFLGAKIYHLKRENRRLRQEIAALEAFDYSQTDRAHALRSVLGDDDPDVRRIY